MRRPTLHKSSIIAGLIVVFVLALIIVPGNSRDRSWSFSATGYAESFRHGWPQVYLERTIFHSWSLGELYKVPPLPAKGIPWLGGPNWRLWEAVQIDDVPMRTFSLWLLTFDVAVALIIVAAVVAAWEYRRRRRAGPFSLRMADLFSAVAVVSIVFAYLVHYHNEYERELLITKDQVDKRSEWIAADPQNCIAPLWVQALFGNQILPNFCWRTSSVSVEPVLETMQPIVGRPISDLAQLSFLRSVSVETDQFHPFDYARLRDIPQMDTLYADCGLTATDVRGISQLVQLRRLKICDLRDVDPDLIARLAAALPRCKIVDPGED